MKFWPYNCKANKSKCYGTLVFNNLNVARASVLILSSNPQLLIISLFETGDGIPQSFQQAIYYYQLAAEQNDVRGLFLLAKCFAEGKGVDQSREKATRYYQLAANLGYTDAQRELNTINESILELKRKECCTRARQFASSLMTLSLPISVN